MEMVGITKEQYKAAFARVATSVAVITVGQGDARYGATVGTLAGLSLDPPLLMFAMQNNSRLLSLIQGGTRFGVNVLAANQAHVAQEFAGTAKDRFAMTHWCEEQSLPRIDNALAWFSAVARSPIHIGDHALITGLIEHAETSAAVPLIYLDRSYISASDVKKKTVDESHAANSINGPTNLPDYFGRERVRIGD